MPRERSTGICLELILIAREIAVLAAAVAGAYTDWKTGYIYDWITLPLIAFGILANLLEQNYFGIALGTGVFALGYVLYYTGKLGGGDVKLYSGIALALPQLNGGPFILSAAVFSSLSAIVFLSVYFLVKYAAKGIDWGYNKDGLLKAGAMAIGFAIYLEIISGIAAVSRTFLMLFAVPVVFGCIFIAFERGIKKEFFLKKIKVSGIEEDEVIALEFMEKSEMEKIRACSGAKGIIGKKEKAELAKIGVKEILVYRDLPRLGPFIFIGCVLAMLVPNISQLITA
ncbi:Type IV leader peptidase family protein [uncultured archaeon]|nr:Type IV leader peptidase family protein [uncultured archaeon]